MCEHPAYEEPNFWKDAPPRISRARFPSAVSLLSIIVARQPVEELARAANRPFVRVVGPSTSLRTNLSKRSAHAHDRIVDQVDRLGQRCTGQTWHAKYLAGEDNEEASASVDLDAPNRYLEVGRPPAPSRIV